MADELGEEEHGKETSDKHETDEAEQVVMVWWAVVVFIDEVMTQELDIPGEDGDVKRLNNDWYSEADWTVDPAET